MACDCASRKVVIKFSVAVSSSLVNFVFRAKGRAKPKTTAKMPTTRRSSTRVNAAVELKSRRAVYFFSGAFNNINQFKVKNSKCKVKVLNSKFIATLEGGS